MFAQRDRLRLQRIADHDPRATEFEYVDHCPGVGRCLQRHCAIPTEMIVGELRQRRSCQIKPERLQLVTVFVAEMRLHEALMHIQTIAHNDLRTWDPPSGEFDP